VRKDNKHIMYHDANNKACRSIYYCLPVSDGPSLGNVCFWCLKWTNQTSPVLINQIQCFDTTIANIEGNWRVVDG